MKLRQFDRITLIVTPMETLFTGAGADVPTGLLIECEVHNTTRYRPWVVAHIADADTAVKHAFRIDEVLLNIEHEGQTWVRGWGPEQRAQLLLVQSAA